ncbi:MAG: ornithine carbamoyltransferase [Deltaproteobacteria bacterium]|nr:ornithine carbamoyltransferase [Deltaproteobacteria bacterium]
MNATTKRDLLSLKNLSRADMEQIFALTRALKRKQKRGISHRLLAGKTLAMIFEKPSLRTRVTFEVGMVQLGGHAVFLGPSEIQIGVRETSADCGRSLSRWVDLIMIRTFSHTTVEELAANASVPVINGLTDLFHPCQVLADCYTLLEHKKSLDGLKIAFICDGNNMAHTWIQAAEKYALSFAIACPRQYEPRTDIAREAAKGGAEIFVTQEVQEAVRDADVIYTDVWTSMGQENERDTRLRAFQRYQVNEELLAVARKTAVVMHCLPAHRGEEITAEVLESPQSIVFDQAENRLHLQKALMVWLLKASKGSRAKTVKASRQ